jgi:hypothetical protein
MPDYPTAASVSCLCEKISAQQIVVAPLASPPPRSPGVSLCHCSICRSASGVLCTSYHRLLFTPESDVGSLILNPSLKEYAQSTQLSRWFCGTCGAHVLAHLRHENKYFVAAGLVTPASASASVSVWNETESVAEHWGVGETRDGGLSIFMPGARNDSSPCLLGFTTEGANPSSGLSESWETGFVDEKRLRAQCHCSGVGFTITRPNSRSREASSPWPDLLVPYHLASSKNPEDVKWWLRAGDTKYLAGACACRSCRLACGFPIQCWAFIPKANLINNSQVENDILSGEGFAYGTGTMQSFESSPGVYREFCKRCGATIFWHCDERPGVVDVSVGLLKSVTGARAEDWLDWETGRVSFAEDAQDKSLIALLEPGLRNPVY